MDYNVLEKELYELFRTIGKLKFCKILEDRKGRSLGKGIVKFVYPEDNKKAIKEFDGAELDGRTLTVEHDE